MATTSEYLSASLKIIREELSCIPVEKKMTLLGMLTAKTVSNIICDVIKVILSNKKLEEKVEYVVKKCSILVSDLDVKIKKNINLFKKIADVAENNQCVANLINSDLLTLLFENILDKENKELYNVIDKNDSEELNSVVKKIFDFTEKINNGYKLYLCVCAGKYFLLNTYQELLTNNKHYIKYYDKDVGEFMWKILMVYMDFLLEKSDKLIESLDEKLNELKNIVEKKVELNTERETIVEFTKVVFDMSGILYDIKDDIMVQHKNTISTVYELLLKEPTIVDDIVNYVLNQDSLFANNIENKLVKYYNELEDKKNFDQMINYAYEYAKKHYF